MRNISILTGIVGLLLSLPFGAVAAPPNPPTSSVVDLSRYFGDYKGAFVLVDVAKNQTIRYNPAQCAREVLPCSTFKIPNSLISVETGVATDENYPLKWDGVKHPMEEWNHDQTLQSAYTNSVVWYYQKLAARVGAERMGRYVRACQYGNQQVPDRFDEIPHFWLDGPLMISPDEQVIFLRKLQAGNVPFSPRTLRIVRKIMVQMTTKDAVLRGKTGTDGDLKTGKLTMGWYVGYVEKNGHPYIFATNIVGGNNPYGKIAKKITISILKDRGIL